MNKQELFYAWQLPEIETTTCNNNYDSKKKTENTQTCCKAAPAILVQSLYVNFACTLGSSPLTS